MRLIGTSEQSRMLRQTLLKSERFGVDSLIDEAGENPVSRNI